MPAAASTMHCATLLLAALVAPAHGRRSAPPAQAAALLEASSKQRGGRFSPLRAAVLPSLAASPAGRGAVPPHAFDVPAASLARRYGHGPSRLRAEPPSVFGAEPPSVVGEDIDSPPETDWVDEVFNDEQKSSEMMDEFLHMKFKEEEDLDTTPEEAPEGFEAPKAETFAHDVPKVAVGVREKARPFAADVPKAAVGATDLARPEKATAGFQTIKPKELEDLEQTTEAGRLAAPGQKTQEAPRITTLLVDGLVDGEPGPHNIALPALWTHRFLLDSIEVFSDGPGLMVERPVLARGFARLKDDPEIVMQFRIFETGAPELQHELEAIRRLRPTGVAPVIFDYVETPEITYILEEPTDRQRGLQSKISHAVHSSQSPVGSETHMSLKRAAPIMASTLRNLARMHDVGVAHGDLTEEDIFETDSQGHTILKNYFAACVADEQFSAFGDQLICLPGEGRGYDTRSPWHQPPEALKYDAPVTAAGDVWQLGLVFAKMLFGTDVATQASVRQAFPHNFFDERTEEGREEIRATVRQYFSLARLPGYKGLRARHPVFVSLVEGMLEADPAKRLTASEALKILESRAPRDLPEPEDGPARVEDMVAAWESASD